MSFIDQKLRQIAKQSQEQLQNTQSLPQERQESKGSFIDQRLEQIAQHSQEQKAKVDFKAKATELLGGADQNKQALTQEPQTPTNEISSQKQQEQQEFDLVEQNPLVNNYINIYQQMQEQMKNNKELQTSYQNLKDTEQEQEKKAANDRAYKKYLNAYKVEPVIDFSLGVYGAHTLKPIYDKPMEYEEYIKLYEQSFDDSVFVGASDKQTQRYIKNNNLNDDFIKLYNSYARDEHFTDLLNPHEFKHKYKKELLEKVSSDGARHKAQLEHYNTYYSDMLKQIRTAIDRGSEEDLQYLKSVQKSINDDLATYFEDSLGLRLAIDESGKYHAIDPQSGLIFDISDELNSFWQSLRTSHFEIVGAVGGAALGAKFGASGGPIGIGAGMVLGGAGGAFLGAVGDSLWEIVALGKEINTHLDYLAKKGVEAALFDVGSTAATSVAFKVVTKTATTMTPKFIKEPIKKGASYLKDHITKEGIGTAERYIQNQFSKEEFDELLSLHQKYQTLDLDGEFFKDLQKQAQTNKDLNAAEIITKTFTENTLETYKRQQQIIAYALSRDDGIQILDEAVTKNPELKIKLIQTINNFNNPLAKMLDEKNFNLDNLVNVSRAVQKEIKNNYSDFMSIMDDLSITYNTRYDTKVFFDDIERLIHTSSFDNETEAKLFKEFINQKTIHLKDTNGDFITKDISLYELNEFRTGLNNIYKEAKQSGFKGFEAWHNLKEITDAHIANYLQSIKDNLPKQISHDLDKIYKKLISDYAIMKTTMDNEYFKSTQKAVSYSNINYDNIINELSTNQKNFKEFSDGTKINRLALYTTLMNEQQKAEFELGFINTLVNRSRLHPNDSKAIVLFDKNEIEKVLQNAEFQTPIGQEFKQTFFETKRLFNNDEKILAILSKAKQPEPSQGISFFPGHRLLTMLGNRTMEVIKRYLPFLGQVSVRHHIRRALEKSSSLIEFQKHLKFDLNELDKTPLLTSTILKDFIDEIGGLIDIQTALKNQNFTKTNFKPIKETDAALLHKIQNERYIINNQKDSIKHIQAPKNKIADIHPNAANELNGQVASDDKVDKFLKDFLGLSSKQIEQEFTTALKELGGDTKAAWQKVKDSWIGKTISHFYKNHKLRIFGKTIAVLPRNRISNRGDITYDVFVENNQNQTPILENTPKDNITAQNIKHTLSQHIKEKSYPLDETKPIRVFKGLSGGDNIEKAEVYFKTKLSQIPKPKQKSKEWWLIDLHGVDISVIKYNDLSFDVFAMINGEKIKLLDKAKKDALSIRYLKDLIEHR